MNKKEYTATEVGAMLEQINHQYHFLAEMVSPIPDRLLQVENRLSSLENRAITLEDAVRIGFRRMENAGIK